MPLYCSFELAMNDTAIPESTKVYSNGYTIYKPNQRGTGGAVRFNLNAEKGAIFLEAASQSGEKQFDWDQKIIMKWGLSDIGAALATLQGRTAQAKLFHKTEKASSTFELTFRDDPERAPYALTITRQEEADKSLRKVSIPLTHAEAAVLEVALRTATNRILGW
jgi:Whirly transcription factor